MTELKELENWKEKSSFWQIWIALARHIFRPFATYTLGTAALWCWESVIFTYNVWNKRPESIFQITRGHWSTL